MDFRFTPEQDEFRSEVSEFIRTELSRRVLEGEPPYSDENFEDTMAFRRKLGQKKWIGIGWPEEYGGLGASSIMQMIFHEEMIYHNGPLDPQAYQVGPAIIGHGSDYLRKKFLSGTADQSIFWAQGFSEPNAGSDLAGLQTRAVRDGDDYVINGQKIWTSMAHKADWVHTLTRTDPDAPKHRGISYFLVDMKSPGIEIRPIVDMTNEHHFNEVYFNNVRVPKENMIGEENQGWYVAMTTLGNERSGIRDVSRARQVIDTLVETVREGGGAGGIRKDPVAMHKLADLVVRVNVSRMMSYHVGWMDEAGIPVSREGPQAKVFGTELQRRAAEVSMEILGLFSQTEGDGRRSLAAGFFPYSFKETVQAVISAGSSEINRNVIATRGLGLPR